MVNRLPMLKLLAVPLLCLIAGAAYADDNESLGTCDPTDRQCELGTCYLAEYPIFQPLAPSTFACEERGYQESDGITLRFPLSAAPESGLIECEAVANCELACQAWPTGPELSYVWLRSGSAQFNPTPMSYESYAMVDILPPGGGGFKVNTNGNIEIKVRVFGPQSSGYTEAAWSVNPESVCSAN